MDSELKICYHCDSICDDELRHEEKSFCCQGCVTVYSILSENDLGNFYKLNERPGVKFDSNRATRFDFLELEEVAQSLMRFRENGVARVKLFLPQIHCSSCLWLLERLNKIHPGVVNCQVFFAEKEAEITFNEAQISLKELAILLQSIGYEPKISQTELKDEGSVKKDYSRILKIGVTGFCFGNIMLLSFPEYLGITGSDREFQSTFNYLNVLFSLPVLIYGAKEYFASSFKTIRAGGINIDVPITLGIIALYTRSLFEIFSGSGAGYLDSFAGLIFFLLIGKWFQQKTYSAISFERDFKSYFPIASARIEQNKEELVSLEKINKGDQLVIRNNELIPADAILVSGVGHIDYSFVTGESTPISKRIGERLFAGGRQSGSTIQIEVVRAVENSYLTRLWNNPIFHKKLPQGSLVDRVSKVFTFAVIGIAVLAGIIWSQIDASRVVFVVTSVLIVACPCALALSVPFTYGNVIRLLGRKALFLRSTEVIEPLSKVTDVVFDKTGTLTETNKSEIQWEGEQLLDIQLDSIYHLSNQSAHPLSRLIAKYVVPSHNINMVKDIIEREGLGLEGEIEGVKWRIGSATWLGQEGSVKETSVYVEENGVVLGRFKMTNVYRSDLANLISDLKGDKEMHVLSGDNDSELDQLGTLFGSEAVLRFDQTPQDKLDYIKHLQKQGRVVLMLGDGLNDAGALKQADVGMAVADDVYAFTPASDAIIEGSRLTRLKAYLDFSKYGIRVVQLSYIFSILYNLVGLAFALSGHLTPLVAAILMPLSSISIVLLVTLLTNIKGRQFQ